MKLFLQSLVLGSALLALAGCGGGGGSGGSTSFNSSSSSSSSVAPMAEVTIQGVVTDGNPIANASVAFNVGVQLFTAKTDASGKYSVTVKTNLTNMDEMVTGVAIGSGVQKEAQFITLLPSLKVLVEQAGSDKVLDSSENFGVNITNVTTAEYSAIKNLDGSPHTDRYLQLSYLYVDTATVAKTAALLKMIVDSPDYNLPEGFATMVEFLDAEEELDDYLYFVAHSDAELLDAASKAIAADAQLTKPANNNLSTLAGITDAKLAKCVNATGASALANILLLNCASMQISSLAGLSNLNNLEAINISENNLVNKSLDVSANTKLKFLVADGNNLTSVNVQMNPMLDHLSLSNNSLTQIDLRKNPELINTMLQSNKLSSLDLQQNTKLDIVMVGDNKLTTLDVTKLPKLSYLWVFGNALTSLDVTKNPLLEVLGVQDVARMDLSNNTKMTDMILVNIPMNTLDVSKMTELNYLHVSGSDIASLNLSNNKKLQYLTLSWTYVDKLDLSQQTGLLELEASNNEFTTLDLSKNTKLTSVDLEESWLVTISGLEFIADKTAEIDLYNNSFSSQTISYLNNLQDKLGYTNLWF